MPSDQIQLRTANFQPTPSGLLISGEPDFHTWEQYGRMLFKIEGSLQFMIGDWLRYGEQKYGEMYAQALTPEMAKTWANYKWVAGKVKPSRRRENVAWSQHAVVAVLPAEVQEEMLDEAEEQQLSVTRLRDKVQRWQDDQNRQAGEEALTEPIPPKNPGRVAVEQQIRDTLNMFYLPVEIVPRIASFIYEKLFEQAHDNLKFYFEYLEGSDHDAVPSKTDPH